MQRKNNAFCSVTFFAFMATIMSRAKQNRVWKGLQFVLILAHGKVFFSKFREVFQSPTSQKTFGLGNWDRSFQILKQDAFPMLNSVSHLVSHIGQ